MTQSPVNNHNGQGGTDLVSLLTRVRQANIQLTVENDNLRVKAPKGKLDDALKRELARQKQALIDFLSHRKTGHDAEPAAPPPRPVDCPLSYAQQALWFSDKLHEVGTVYIEPAAIVLDGDLNLAAFEQSFTDLAARHETLRTLFIEKDGQPVQVIQVPAPVTYAYTDVSQLEEPVAALQSLCDRETREGFDLSTGPLWRLHLVRTSSRSHTLILCMHHIISDGWSLGVLLQDLANAYAVRLQGQAPDWPRLRWQYADYAVAQRTRSRDQRDRDDAAYWQRQLADAPAWSGVPFPGKRPAVFDHRGDTCHFRWDGALYEQLKTCNRQWGSTLYLTLLTAFSLLLYRLSGSRDMVLGSLLSGRNRPELEPLIGFFANALALRIAIDPAQSFPDCLDGVRRVVAGATDHQSLPFEGVVEAVNPARTSAYHSLFQTVFVFQPAALHALSMPGLDLAMAPVRMTNDTAKFDLVMSVTDTGDGLSGRLEFYTGIYNRVDMTSLINRWEHLLRSLVTAPDRPVGQLNPITPADQAALAVTPDLSQLSPSFPAAGVTVHSERGVS